MFFSRDHLNPPSICYSHTSHSKPPTPPHFAPPPYVAPHHISYILVHTFIHISSDSSNRFFCIFRRLTGRCALWRAANVASAATKCAVVRGGSRYWDRLWVGDRHRRAQRQRVAACSRQACLNRAIGRRSCLVYVLLFVFAISISHMYRCRIRIRMYPPRNVAKIIYQKSRLRYNYK